MEKVLSSLKTIENFDKTPANLINFFDSIDNLAKVATYNAVEFIDIPYIKAKINSNFYPTIFSVQILSWFQK